MITKWKISILLFSLMILPTWAMTAPFQSDSKSVSLTPFISVHSGYEFGKLNPLPNTSDVPEITVLLENRGVTIEASLGYFLTKHFEFQGTFTYGRAKIMNDVGIGIGGFPLGKNKVSDAAIYSYSGNILYHIPLGESSIFFTAGMGGLTLNPEIFNSKTRWMLNFGVGIRVKFSDHIHPVLEIRDYISFFNYGEDFDITYIAIYTPDFKKSQHHVGIRIGFSYLF